MPAKDSTVTAHPAGCALRTFEMVRRGSPAALARALPAGLTLDWRPRRLVERTYLDSHDWRLWGAGATLVVEAVGGTQTVIWRPARGGAVMVDGAPTPRLAADLPEGTVRREVQPLLGERALLPLAALRVQQRPGTVRDERGKIVARLGWERSTPLDRTGEAAGPARTALLVEGVRGYEGSWRAIQVAWERLPFLKGAEQDELALAAAARGRTPGDCSSRIQVPLTDDTPAAEATRLILRHLLETASANLLGAIDDVDPEFLHDLRVAVRRARSALGQLAGSLDPARFARLREELRWLGGVTGPCRDLDVFLMDLEGYGDELGEPARTHLAPLLDHLRRQRQRQHRELEAALTSPRLRRLLATWRRVTEPPRRPPATPEGQQPAREYGAARVQRAYRRLRRHARQLGPQAPAEGLHQLRIDAKKLRYLLEFFAPLLGRPAATLIRQLKELQDALGTFNDLAVQQRKLADLLGEVLASGGADAAAALAAGRLAALLEARGEAQRAAVWQRLDTFFAPEVRAEVAALGAGGGT
ncbi:MAG: CHAD domain-containing protein [Acidobacteriota bacterium]|jgi:CHAD domain-containing protein